MKFKLTTDKGTFYSIPQRELNTIELSLQLSSSLVDSLFENDISTHSDDIQSYAIVLRQMFHEMRNNIKHESVEITEEQIDNINDIDKPNEPVVDSSSNVVSFNFRKKDE